MRELKFRVWDIKNEKFIYEYDACHRRLAISFNGKVYHGAYDDVLSASDYIIQQYTGLEDKNGKKIYEGDIVKGICLTYGDSIAVVVLDTTFGIFYTDIDYYPATAFSHCFSMMQEYNEVIGNIFENPELLEQ